MPSFDLAVIGAGPGGFDAALRARELGLKVALIEKREPGGACLNTGCIPAKSLLASAKLLAKISEAPSYGISVSGVSADFASWIERKNRIVETLKKGMADSLRRSGVEWIRGEASFTAKDRLAVKKGIGTQEIAAKSLLIATGSEPLPFPGAPFDGKRVLSSADILELKTLPQTLLIIGGGVVGVEFASIFQPLGVKVTIVEMLERLISNEDEEVGRRLESIFRRKGIEIHTGKRLKSLAVKGERVEAILNPGLELEAGQVLVATGRRPCVENLALEAAGVRTEGGAIGVDEYFETSTSGIFAIGDVTNRTTGLAHGASAEGVLVVENLKGAKRKLNRAALPNCIYTDPEVASVGSTALGCEGEIISSKILFGTLGKPHVEGESEGFVKMFASPKEGRILGVTGIGGHLTELIQEAALAIQAGLTVETVAQTVHAHPTESEILQKAAQKLARVITG